MIIQDEYGCVLNRPETYKTLASVLTDGSIPVVFAWTDEEGSQLDIMLVYDARQYGFLQRGMSADTDLFVGVSRCGFFGFEINDIEKHPDYVAEKLNLSPESITTAKLAELINGVIKELQP